jgi:ribonuclease HI
MIEGWFDGVCEPRNPGGHAAYGILVKVDGETKVARGRYVDYGPAMSNNVAEFSGFIALLEEIKKLPGPAIVRGDSKLVIYTLTGKYKVKQGLYVPYFIQARTLFEPERERIGLEWIGRDKNEECDVLSKGVLKERGIRLRIQPSSTGPFALKSPRRRGTKPFPTTVDEAIAEGYTMRHQAVECRGCPAIIDFWTTPNDKKIPVETGTFNVHFATCPGSEQFRKKRGSA